MNQKTAKIIIVLWYSVGIAGFSIHPLRPLFQWLTPFGMVAAAIFLLWFHRPGNLKSWLVFAAIALVGFVVELIGVNFQTFFGHYEYGNALGFKLWNTPLVIGLNWLVLIYCIASLFAQIRETWYFPLVGAAAMVAFDWVMEPVAANTGMWTWADGSVPVKNYIDWFVISGLLFGVLRILKIEIRNRIASVLLLMQLIFFLALNLLIRTPIWDF